MKFPLVTRREFEDYKIRCERLMDVHTKLWEDYLDKRIARKKAMKNKKKPVKGKPMKPKGC